MVNREELACQENNNVLLSPNNHVLPYGTIIMRGGT